MAEIYADARPTLENAIKNNGDSALVRAALGDLVADDYVLYGGSKNNLDRALELVDSAYRLNPNEYVVQFTRAFVHFYTHPAVQFRQALELALQTKPYSSMNGDLALWCACTGQPDRAVALFERVRQMNPHIPGWYYLTPFLAHAYRADYEQALSAAQEIRMPDLHADAIARAAALGHLDRQDEAIAVVAELLELVPDFKESGQETIQRIFRYNQPVELLLEGLRKAGMEI